MRNNWFLLLTCLLLACCPAWAQVPGKSQTPRTPAPGLFDTLGQKPSGGWENSGQMPYSFASAKIRMKVKKERQGYRLVHEIDMGKRNDHCLLLWEKNGRQTLVMLWRIDVNKTGYSLGEIKDKKK